MKMFFFFFRYALMRSCWHEDPDKRLTFRKLHKALNKLDKEIQVQKVKNEAVIALRSIKNVYCAFTHLKTQLTIVFFRGYQS